MSVKGFFRRNWKAILFQMYVFLVLVGVGIGTVEYTRYRRAVQPTGGGEVQQGENAQSESMEIRITEEYTGEEMTGALPARIALTFDDGPHPLYTPELLEGLKERDVRATFFLIGKNISGNEDIIKQMDQDGHLIGNHTWSHVKITDLNAEKACEEITKTSELVKSITGKNTEYIRPPFGSWDKDLECSFVMFPVLWSVDPLDWTTSNTDQVVERVVSEAEENDIILLHDCYASSVEAALRIVDILKAEGYEFVTVDKLILE